MESGLQASTLNMIGSLLQYYSQPHKSLHGTVTQVLARLTGIHKPVRYLSNCVRAFLSALKILLVKI